MSQYIGKTISLISSKGIRYVGVLQDVNGEAATVTLNNVKPYGTEGRLGNPAKEIPPSEDVFPVVVFKGSDVHDLSVLDDEPAPSAPSAPQQPQQPQQPQPPQPQAKDHDSDDEPKYQRQPRAPRQPRQNAFNSEVPKDDFDFGSSDAIDQLRHQEEDAETHEQQAPAYDKKKSFFDTISSSANEPARPQRNFHNRGRGRGGNWSRGRGRGRGGYNNQPSWA